MKKLLVIIVCWWGFFKLEAQVNLVPNPSFETHTTCTGILGFKYYGMTPNIVPPWYSPSGGSPDYFNTCASSPGFNAPSNNFGFQYPRTGNAFAGIGVYSTGNSPSSFREYLQVQLTDTLIQNNTYCVSFYISYTPFINSLIRNTYAISDLGLYLSDTVITINVLSTAVLNYTPQIKSPSGVYLTDTVNWVEVSGTYVAHGGEKFITIGNFKNDANIDTLLYATNTTSSTANTDVSYYYIDDISVKKCNVGISELNNDENFQLFPNPATNELSILLTNSNLPATIHIYNVLGEEMLNKVEQSGSTTIDISGFATGMYYIEAASAQGMQRKRFLKQ